MSNEAQTIADLATRAERLPVVFDDVLPGRTLIVTPNDMQVQEFKTDPHGLIVEPPPRIVQGVTIQTVESLVEYVNGFKTATTVLFADIDYNTIVAAIDYHGNEDPHHVSHSARLVLPHSVEWKLWTGNNTKLLPQLDFARFLEENAPDVLAPSGAELLEVCQDLHARRKVDFRKAVRTATDNESFEFSDETTATAKNGAIELPTKFLLSIPVYFGGSPTSLNAFLRWRLEEGSLLLGYALNRHEHVRQAVFKQAVLEVAERTGVSAIFGKLDR